MDISSIEGEVRSLAKGREPFSEAARILLQDAEMRSFNRPGAARSLITKRSFLVLDSRIISYEIAATRGKSSNLSKTLRRKGGLPRNEKTSMLITSTVMRKLVPELLGKHSQEKITLALEMLARSYDPCISCATHLLDVKFV
jgi:hypothetical protein